MNKKFVLGFMIGLLLFLAICLFAAHLASDCGIATFSASSACADGIVRFGWPLQFYESGGFMYQQSFNFLFLMIDLAIGLALGVLMGRFFSHRKEALPK